AGDGRAVVERRAHLSARVAGLEKDSKEEEARAGRLESALREREGERTRAAGESSELRAEVEQLAVSAAEASRTASEAEARALARRPQHAEDGRDGLGPV